MVRRKTVQKLLQEVVEKIRTGYDPEKIILYGSHAYGKPTKDSDIDLFIVKETDKSRVDRFVEVSTLIDEWESQISIEPLVYTPDEVGRRLAVGDGFVLEIMEKGIVLYAR